MFNQKCFGFLSLSAAASELLDMHNRLQTDLACIYAFDYLCTFKEICKKVVAGSDFKQCPKV